MNTTPMRYFDFGEFRLDTNDQSLFKNGERVAMTLRSFQVLRALVSKNGQLVRHDELMREVWRETAVDQSSLKQTIALVRKALGEAGDEPKFIQTVPKFGYRFVAPVDAFPDENLTFIAERRRVTEIEIEERRSPAPTARLFGRPTLAAYGLLALVGILAAVAATWVIANRAASSSTSERLGIDNVIPERLTDSGDIAGGVLSADGKLIAYSDSSDGSTSSMWVRQVDSRESSQLVKIEAPDGFGAFTFTNDGKWIYYIVANGGDWGPRAVLSKISIFGGKPRRIMQNLDSFVSFSPDDSRMVYNRFTTEGCQLLTSSAVDGSGERVIAQGRTNQEFLEPKWSPDGTEILFFSAERRSEGNYWSLSTIEAEGGRITNIIPPTRQHIWHIAWTRSGNVVINATDPATRLPQLYVVDRSNGSKRRLTNDLYYYNGVSVGGDSVLSAKQERPSHVWISDLGGSSPAPRKIADGAFFDSINWTPDGSRLVVDGSDDGHRHIWAMDPMSGLRDILSNEKAEELLPKVSPDGKSVVFISNRGGTYEVWTSKIDGSEPRQLTSGNSWLSHVEFAPDGRSIYFSMIADNAQRLANVPFEGGPSRIVFPDADLGLFAVSPDGRRVAYSVSDAQTGKTLVVLRELVNGETIRTFEISVTRFLKFTSDGSALVFKNSDTRVAPISSVWIQPIDGSKARQLIDFKSDDVFGADVSPDGKKIAVVRGKLTSDLILLTAGQR